MRNAIRVSLFVFASALALSAPGFADTAQVAGGLNGDSMSAIKHLADRYADSAKGYENAAKNVRDESLKNLFLKRARQRADYRRELLQKAGVQNEEKANGSFEAGLHRAWMSVKSVFARKDDLAVVETVRSGEEEAVKSFSDLLGQPLPDQVRSTVQSQYESVLDSYKWASDEVMHRSDETGEDVKMDKADDKTVAKTGDAKDKTGDSANRIAEKTRSDADRARDNAEKTVDRAQDKAAAAADPARTRSSDAIEMGDGTSRNAAERTAGDAKAAAQNTADRVS